MNEIASVILIAVVVAVVAGAAAWAVAARRFAAPLVVEPVEGPSVEETVGLAVGDAVRQIVADLRTTAGAERDEAIQVALRQAAELNRQHLDAAGEMNRQQLDAASERQAAELGAKKELIAQGLGDVRAEMRQELQRLNQIVSELGERNAERFGQVDASLRSHSEAASALANTTKALSEALSSPQARGQWGERMAEDVLRLAGLVENVNYVKQVQMHGATGRPDYTFTLPKGHALYMDVKFPMAAYLRYLESPSESDRKAHLRQFLSDARARVRELAKRDYARESGQQSVDYVLLFMPNEQLTSFIVEHDQQFFDDALTQRVVVCSPLTLFAFLGIVRQAFDMFMLEQTSDEILRLIGTFGKEWDKYTASADKVKNRFDSVAKEFEHLVGTRRRVLERPLRQLDDIRRERNLPVDGELFVEPEDDDDVVDNVRQLGA